MFRRSLVAALGLALAFSPGAMSQPAPVPQAIVGKKQRRGLFNGWAYSGPSLIGSKGAGITMAQQKRAAQTKRNQARHKAAVKR